MTINLPPPAQNPFQGIMGFSGVQPGCLFPPRQFARVEDLSFRRWAVPLPRSPARIEDADPNEERVEDADPNEEPTVGQSAQRDQPGAPNGAGGVPNIPKGRPLPKRGPMLRTIQSGAAVSILALAAAVASVAQHNMWNEWCDRKEAQACNTQKPAVPPTCKSAVTSGLLLRPEIISNQFWAERESQRSRRFARRWHSR